VLAEAIRLGTAPAGIVLGEADAILPLGAIVAAELYDTFCPVVVVDLERVGRLRDGQRVAVQNDGSVEW
jgi:predicted aconitase with swiveling domain